MKSLLFLVLMVSLLIEYKIHGLSVITNGEREASVRRSDEIVERTIRVKRAPLIKLPLLAGAALVGKKALLVGGAVVGAKALAGAGILGAAALYKAKHYSGGGYGAGSYQDYHSVDVHSTWG